MCPGADDLAFRSGNAYATILVDLVRGTTIDLLPDCSRETLKAWLERYHPGGSGHKYSTGLG